MRMCKRCGGDMAALPVYKSITTHCRECWKAKVREHRSQNIDRIQAYDRSRGSLPHRVAARMGYAKTDADKRHAHTTTSNAIRHGKLVKMPCEVCGSVNVEAHHDDYNQPLAVRWLCVTHHAEHHKMQRELKRQTKQMQEVS